MKEKLKARLFPQIGDDKSRKAYRADITGLIDRARTMFEDGNLTDEELADLKRVLARMHLHGLDQKQYDADRASGMLDQLRDLAGDDNEDGDNRAGEARQIAAVRKIVGNFLDGLYDAGAIDEADYTRALDEFDAVPEEDAEGLASRLSAEQEASWNQRNPPNPHTPRGPERLEAGDVPMPKLDVGDPGGANSVFVNRTYGGGVPDGGGITVSPYDRAAEQGAVTDAEYEAWKQRRHNRKGVR